MSDHLAVENGHWTQGYSSVIPIQHRRKHRVRVHLTIHTIANPNQMRAQNHITILALINSTYPLHSRNKTRNILAIQNRHLFNRRIYINIRLLTIQNPHILPRIINTLNRHTP